MLQHHRRPHQPRHPEHCGSAALAEEKKFAIVGKHAPRRAGAAKRRHGAQDIEGEPSARRQWSDGLPRRGGHKGRLRVAPHDRQQRRRLAVAVALDLDQRIAGKEHTRT